MASRETHPAAAKADRLKHCARQHTLCEWIDEPQLVTNSRRLSSPFDGLLSAQRTRSTYSGVAKNMILFRLLEPKSPGRDPSLG